MGGAIRGYMGTGTARALPLLPNPKAAKNENESPEGLSFSLVAGTGTLLVCGYTRKPVVPNPGSLT